MKRINYIYKMSFGILKQLATRLQMHPKYIDLLKLHLSFIDRWSIFYTTTRGRRCIHTSIIGKEKHHERKN